MEDEEMDKNTHFNLVRMTRENDLCRGPNLAWSEMNMRGMGLHSLIEYIHSGCEVSFDSIAIFYCLFFDPFLPSFELGRVLSYSLSRADNKKGRKKMEEDGGEGGGGGGRRKEEERRKRRKRRKRRRHNN